MSVVEELKIPPPQPLRDRVLVLSAHQQTHSADLAKAQARLDEVRRYLELAPKVTAALEQLSEELFNRLVKLLEQKLTLMIQEVLEQPIRLKATTAFRRGSMNVDFHLERDGNTIDIMEGSGGSVANVLSVGLRLFALTTLDPAQHSRFLVLDEQDCWLKPELVPKLVKIVHDAGQALGFQVLMISHHDPALFAKYADRIYGFHPQPDGTVKVELRQSQPVENDEYLVQNIRIPPS